MSRFEGIVQSGGDTKRYRAPERPLSDDRAENYSLLNWHAQRNLWQQQIPLIDAPNYILDLRLLEGHVF